jgi:hypothetical protein
MLIGPHQSEFIIAIDGFQPRDLHNGGSERGVQVPCVDLHFALVATFDPVRRDHHLQAIGGLHSATCRGLERSDQSAWGKCHLHPVFAVAIHMEIPTREEVSIFVHTKEVPAFVRRHAGHSEDAIGIAGGGAAVQPYGSTWKESAVLIQNPAGHRYGYSGRRQWCHIIRAGIVLFTGRDQ